MLLEFGYEAMGKVSSRMQIVTDWQDAFNKGVIYYLESVRGGWNVWKQTDQTRALLMEAGPFQAADLKGRWS